MEWLVICFPGGRHKALTLSYDDGKIADRRLVEILNRHGLKASFNLNGDKFGRDGRIERGEVAGLYQGHEIAAHSLTHPTLSRCPREIMVQQIFDDRRRLEDLAGYPVRGFAYPNGQHTPDLHRLLPELGIAYARTIDSNGQFLLPTQPMAWHPTCHHKDRLLERAEAFLARQKSQYLDLFYLWGHSYEFDNDNNWDVIEQFSALMSGHDDIWYASNIDIIDYLDAAQRLRLTARGDVVHNPSAISVWVRYDKHDDHAQHPVICEVPPGATIRLPQDGKPST